MVTTTENPFEAASAELSRRTTETVERAVREWSAQLGVTVEQWCRWYVAVVGVVPADDGLSLRVVVTAEPRRDA